MGERAAAVRMTRCDLQRDRGGPGFRRGRERHPLGGFVGQAEYEGKLGEFLPYLRLGKWVGVGSRRLGEGGNGGCVDERAFGI